MQLARKFPTPSALEELLYGSPSASAEDADVIALLLNDLVVTEESAENLQHLLLRSLRQPEDYISNEDDKALVIRHIPAHQARLTEPAQRFVALAVAVHRRNVPEIETDSLHATRMHQECFPVPVYLTCKSPRKNQVLASGKAVIVQDVVLHAHGAVLDLVSARPTPSTLESWPAKTSIRLEPDLPRIVRIIQLVSGSHWHTQARVIFGRNRQ